ncbi:MAG TPA: DUF1800 domain-containing protein [Chryseolinea sp.]
MKSPRNLFASIPSVVASLKGYDLQPPSPTVIALNRLTYGATPELSEQVTKRGVKDYLEEQLHPKGEDERVVRKLSEATLPIKYNDKDGNPLVDEVRSLRLIDAPLSELWKLNNKDANLPYAEKIRALEEVRVASWFRAVYSPWQLREVMAEFWHNHFNVNASDQKISTVFPVYDRDVIRKNCFGNFRAFLEDVSKSAAMLYYLDNFTSKASPANENYARELFELHTLGSDFYFNNLYNRWRDVPGATAGKPVGYIDEDVYEAARAFTGWTVADGASSGKDKLPDTGEFYYYDGWHDNYQKRILGTEIEPNQPALSDGHLALDLVAHHPATAKHLCKKLCIRFLSDQPPPSVVEGAVKVWIQNQKSPDQIGQTLRYIINTKEFATTWGQKVKRPFHLMVSMLRATQAEITPNQGLTGQLSQMGYLHYNWQTPTGHPDVMDYWLSSNSMIARWNVATSLLSVSPNNRIAAYDFARLVPPGMDTPQDLSRFWIDRVLQKRKTPDFEQAMIDFLRGDGKADQPIPPDKLNNRLSGFIALLTMTPDFQLI